MSSSLILLSLCIYAVISNGCCLPTPAGRGPEMEVVKREIYEDNHDAGLKQVSLQSLIGDLEQSLFQSALSVGGIAYNDDFVVPEVVPSTTVHTLAKRYTNDAMPKEDHQQQQTSSATAASGPHQLESTTESLLSSNDKILLQTTAKVPRSEEVPAHILIDRVSVQPHYGGVPLIPSFVVQHTKVMASAAKQPVTSESSENGATKQITITKTALTAVSNAVVTVPTDVSNGDTLIAVQSEKSKATPAAPAHVVTSKLSEGDATARAVTSASAATQSSTPSTSLTSTTSTTTTSTSNPTTSPTTSSSTTKTTSSTTTTTTTTAPIKEVKDAEEELREKVAEIEAEPIILSARV